jgi:hypothetical protein
LLVKIIIFYLGRTDLKIQISINNNTIDRMKKLTDFFLCLFILIKGEVIDNKTLRFGKVLYVKGEPKQN